MACDSGEGRELGMQMEFLRRWAAENGYTVTGETAEVGSGIRAERPGLAEITRAVREKKMKAVVVKDLAHLTRDYIAGARYIDFLQAEDVKLVSINDGFCTETMSTFFTRFKA